MKYQEAQVNRVSIHVHSANNITFWKLACAYEATQKYEY